MKNFRLLSRGFLLASVLQLFCLACALQGSLKNPTQVTLLSLSIVLTLVVHCIFTQTQAVTLSYRRVAVASMREAFAVAVVGEGVDEISLLAYDDHLVCCVGPSESCVQVRLDGNDVGEAGSKIIAACREWRKSQGLL